jgi:hypothetical protein
MEPRLSRDSCQPEGWSSAKTFHFAYTWDMLASLNMEQREEVWEDI